MEIPAGAVEQQAAERAEHRVAEIAVQRRHRSAMDHPGEAVAHDKLGAVAKAVEEQVQLAEIIAVVAVAHDDITAPRRTDAGAQGAAVAFLRHPDKPGAETVRQFDRTVRAAVVGHQDFAPHPRAGEEAERLADARRQRPCLIQAGHQDGQFQALSGRCGRGRDRFSCDKV